MIHGLEHGEVLNDALDGSVALCFDAVNNHLCFHTRRVRQESRPEDPSMYFAQLAVGILMCS